MRMYLFSIGDVCVLECVTKNWVPERKKKKKQVERVECVWVCRPNDDERNKRGKGKENYFFFFFLL